MPDGRRHSPFSSDLSRRKQLAVIVVGVVAAIIAGALLFLRPQGLASQLAWTRFGTQDVHSLAFMGNDAQRVLFGHHGGLEASLDGGRSWTALPLTSDAMSTSPAADNSIVIAGHEVFLTSRDGGATWAIDRHGPPEPGHSWLHT